MVYLDNAATTPFAPEVEQAMLPYFEGEFGNASSVYQLGSRARVALEEARNVIATAIHAEPKEIVFTSGGTEANNAAIKGAIFKIFEGQKSWNDIRILTSAAEHHAVLEPMEWLSKTFGVSVNYVPLTPFGHAEFTFVEKNTTLVSLMMVNNETGAINNIAEMAKTVKQNSRALIHTDAVQAFGKIPIDVRELGVDFLSLSAHKIHGPKGIGALYIKSSTPWEPLLHGGAQERNRRGGTEAVALAVGFAEAVKHIPSLLQERGQGEGSSLLAQLQQIPEIVLNSAIDGTSLDSILNFSFVPNILSKLEADSLIMRYDLEGICVSNGSACTSGSQQPSHVLIACGRSKDVAMKSVRVSLSRHNTQEDVDAFIRATKKIIATLQ